MAMTLADIRTKYPDAYKGVDDKTLADAIYQKYYSRADRREFDARIGLNPYDNAGEVAVKAVAGAPGNVMLGVSGMAQQLAEGEAGNPNALLDQMGPKFKLSERPGIDEVNLLQWGRQQLGLDTSTPLTPEQRQQIEALAQSPQGKAQFTEYLSSGKGLGTSPQRIAQADLKGQLERQQINKSIPAIDAAPGSVESVVGNAVGSIAQMAPGYAASIMTRNPLPAMTLAQTLTQGQAYAQARDAGVEPGKAAEYAIQSGFAEAIGEGLPLGMILKEGGGKLLPKLFKAGVSEATQEAVTQVIQSLLQSGTVSPDMTWNDVKNQVVAAAAAGAAAGGVLTGAVHGVEALGGKKPTAESVSAEVLAPPTAVETPVVAQDTPIEEHQALPAPGVMLALPSPEAFAPPPSTRRHPAAPTAPEGIAPARDETDYAARIALQKSRQTETKELLQTARETITPLGTFTTEEIGGEAAQRVNALRIRTGQPLTAPFTVEEMARAKVPQTQIDAIIGARRPRTNTEALTALDITRAAAAKNIIADDTNFGELAYRAVGARDPKRMTQAQLGALKDTLDNMPAHPAPVTVPIAEAPAFTEDQYGKSLDALRRQGRYTAQAIKDATGLKSNKDVAALRDAMVRRGQLVQRSPSDFRLYDTLGEERQTTPEDLPPGAFKEYVVRRVPVSKLRLRRDGKLLPDSHGSGSEVRARVSQIRAEEAKANKPMSALSIEPAEDVAHGVMENRYDEAGNLIGQVVVDTHRDAADAQKAADRLNNPDVGGRYTATPVTPTLTAEPAAPVRTPPPEALAGRTKEVLQRLNKLAKERNLPLLGTRVTIKPEVLAADGSSVEGMYLRNLITIAATRITPEMSTDQVVSQLAEVMDHETIHALRKAGVLGPETDGWKTIVRYARRAKQPGTSETYMERARRLYAGVPGYGTEADLEEEAIAEAFRHWAANRRNVVGKPATVFSQIVEWFKRLFRSIPDDVFSAIETGQMVADALTPPGSAEPRATATRAMESAAAGVTAAQAAKDENLVRVKSREYLRARAQAREDRYGRSGPKTVLGTTPSKAYAIGSVDDGTTRPFVAGVVDKFKTDNGVTASRLMTLLPEPIEYLKKIADAQQRAAHSPKANDVAKAYRALIDETKAMFKALGPLEISEWTGDGAPYASPAEMLADIAAGKLRMRLSNEMFGPGADNPGHPFNAVSGYRTTDGKDLTVNDIFRVVHDVYGHGQSGFRDDPRGAYNAYHEHALLLSPEARRALATETLAQRAWQDYGAHLRRSDGTVPRPSDVDYLNPKFREFAEQKAFAFDDESLAADPGFALAEAASTAEPLEDAAKLSKFDDNLPGGRLYGNPNRSPGGALSKPGTPTPSFTNPRPGNQYFGGELAEHQMQMARAGERGAALIYLSPEEFLSLSDPALNPEQDVYDAAINEGYKFSGFPSLVLDGYAGNVRAAQSDATFSARALAGRADSIPVMLYPKRAEGIGLITALEAPDGSRVPFPREGMQEFIPDNRGPRYSVGSEQFRKWFGDSKVVDENGAPKVMYHGTNQKFNAFETGRRGKRQVLFSEIETISGGMFFSPLEEDAEGYGANVLPVYLSVQNPLDPAAMPMSSRSSDAEKALSAQAYADLDYILQPLVNDGYIDTDGGVSSMLYDPYTVMDTGYFDWGWLDNPEVAQRMRERGYDGVKVAEPNDQSGESWFVLNPTQIKSAVNNNGQYDVANPDIRYSLNAPFGTRVPQRPTPEEFRLYDAYVARTHDPLDPLHSPPRDASELSPDTFNIVHQRVEGYMGRFLEALGRSKSRIPLTNISIFNVRRTHLDEKMLPIKEMLEEAKRDGAVLTNLNDTYVEEMLYHGRVYHQVDRREKTLYLDLMNTVKEVIDTPIGNTGTHIDLQDIDEFLIARHVPERNAFLRAKGSPLPNPAGATDEWASMKLDEFALAGKTAALERVAEKVYAVIRDTNKVRLESGQIDQKTFDSEHYEYYVPLRGIAADELKVDDLLTPPRYRGKGKMFSVRDKTDVTAKGRSRMATDIIGHTFLQNTETVIRAEKNNVAKSFIRFLLDNPALQERFGKVTYGKPPKLTGSNGIVVARVGGKDVTAYDVPDAIARTMAGDSPAISSWWIKKAGQLNRYLAAIHTAFSPVYMIRGFVRDATNVAIMGQQYDVKDFGRKVFGHVPAAMKGIYEVLVDGTANSQMAQAFTEMQSLGGTSEFSGIRDLEQQQKRLLATIIGAKGNPTIRQTMDMWRATLGYIENVGKVAENSFRLATFVTARQAGVSPKLATVMAKRISVNFTQGSQNKTLLNSLYVFYNANMVGNAGMMRALKSKRVQKLAFAGIAAGAMLDMIMRAVSGDDDHDGRPDYDQIDQWTKQTNWVLKNPFGPGYMAVPMPYGWNTFPAFGRNLSTMGYRIFMGEEPAGVIADAVKDQVVTTLEAFNPLGGLIGVLNFLSPTAASPIVNLETNKNPFGQAIVPERGSFGAPIPESQKYYASTNEVPKTIAALMNSATGGNEVRPGAVDVSPETIRYLWDFLTPDIAKLAFEAGFAASDAATGLSADKMPGDAPLLNKFYIHDMARSTSNLYYQIADEVQTVGNEYDLFIENGRDAELDKLFAEKGPELDLILPMGKNKPSLFSENAKEITGLRKLKEQLLADGDRAGAKEIDKEITANMAAFNRSYLEAKGLVPDRFKTP